MSERPASPSLLKPKRIPGQPKHRKKKSPPPLSNLAPPAPPPEYAADVDVELPSERFTLYELLAGRRGTPHPTMEAVIMEKELDFVVLGILELFRDIYKSKSHAVSETWFFCRRLTTLPMGPESIAIKRGALLLCLFQERDVQTHFREMHDGIDAALVDDLVTRVLPLLIPRYIASSFMRPASLVVLTLMFHEMWPAQRLGAFPHPKRTRAEYEALKAVVMSRELEEAKRRQLGHARLRQLGNAGADRVAQPSSCYVNTDAITSALEVESDVEEDDQGAGVSMLIARGQVANKVHVKAWTRKDKTKRVDVNS
jgi:hypothetical protein